MKRLMIVIAAVFLFCVPASFATESPVEKNVEGALDTFVDGCDAELTTYCQYVTPGEGRVMACLYAFSDMLSPRCEYAMYTSMAELKKTIAELSYTIGECKDDLKTNCSDIKPGERRLLDCLKSNEAKISKKCITALKDVGWEK